MNKKLVILTLFMLVSLGVLSCAEERTLTITSPKAGDDYSSACTARSSINITWESNAYTGTVKIEFKNTTLGDTIVVASSATDDGAFTYLPPNYACAYGNVNKIIITQNESGIIRETGLFTVW